MPEALDLDSTPLMQSHSPGVLAGQPLIHHGLLVAMPRSAEAAAASSDVASGGVADSGAGLGGGKGLFDSRVGSEGPRTFYPLVDRFFRGVA